jgi:hypothetical protein
MAGSTHIPNSPACGQWETLLADALDGLLRPEDETTFSGHMAICPACTALFEEARRGREWLEFLSSEPEVPEGLLYKILAATGPGQVAGYGLVTGSDVLPIPQPWQRPGFMARVRRFAEPRLMMTAAMAFFSIALTLNLTGVRLSDLRISNLRPTAIRSFMERRLTMASTAAKQHTTCQPGRIQTESPPQRWRFPRRPSATVGSTGDQRLRLSRDLSHSAKSIGAATTKPGRACTI